MIPLAEGIEVGVVVCNDACTYALFRKLEPAATMARLGLRVIGCLLRSG